MNKKIMLTLGALVLLAALSGCVPKLTSQPVVSQEQIEVQQQVEMIEQAPTEEAAVNESLDAVDAALEDIDEMPELEIQDLDSSKL